MKSLIKWFIGASIFVLVASTLPSCSPKYGCPAENQKTHKVKKHKKPKQGLGFCGLGKGDLILNSI